MECSRLTFALLVVFLSHPFFRLRAMVQGARPQGAWQKEWLRWGSAWALRILHVKVESRGQIPMGGLLVSNHQGYLDILCLNVLCTSVFVAKAEIKSWPLFGLFCEWSGTIFLDRKHRTALRGPLEMIFGQPMEPGRERKNLSNQVSKNVLTLLKTMDI